MWNLLAVIVWFGEGHDGVVVSTVAWHLDRGLDSVPGSVCGFLMFSPCLMGFLPMVYPSFHPTVQKHADQAIWCLQIPCNVQMCVLVCPVMNSKVFRPKCSRVPLE